MKSARGAYSLLAVLALWSGGGFGCGAEVPPGPQSAPPEPVEERNAVPPSEDDGEDGLDVSAAWNSSSRSCEGLVPSGPGEGRFVNQESNGEQCLPGASDGRGNLALGIFSAMLDSASWTVFTPAGSPRGSFAGGVVNVLLPQKSGFHLMSLAFGSEIVSFRAFSRTGALLVQRELIRPSTGSVEQPERGGGSTRRERGQLGALRCLARHVAGGGAALRRVGNPRGRQS